VQPERVATRRKAIEDGAWVREAAVARKRNRTRTPPEAAIDAEIENV
jgi:hypothetical protein